MAEYQTKINDNKIAAVDEVKDRFSDIKDFIFTDFRGLSVEQRTELRNKLREKNAEYRVIKNRQAIIAFEQMEYPDVSGFLVGPTALALTKDESGPVAKVLFDFGKDTSVEVKGALIDGQIFDSGQVEAFSKLPTKDELIAKLMGTMQAPVQHLAGALNEVVAKLIRTIKAVGDNKQQ